MSARLVNTSCMHQYFKFLPKGAIVFAPNDKLRTYAGSQSNMKNRTFKNFFSLNIAETKQSAIEEQELVKFFLIYFLYMNCV